MSKVKLNVAQCPTCYDAQKQMGVQCNRQTCKHWITSQQDNNCVINAAKRGPHTLNDIGEMYGLSRMRICQIEKQIRTKLKELLKKKA